MPQKDNNKSKKPTGEFMTKPEPIALPMEHIRRIMGDAIMEVRYKQQDYILLRHGKAVAKFTNLTKEEITKYSKPNSGRRKKTINQ